MQSNFSTRLPCRVLTEVEQDSIGQSRASESKCASALLWITASAASIGRAAGRKKNICPLRLLGSRVQLCIESEIWGECKNARIQDKTQIMQKTAQALLKWKKDCSSPVLPRSGPSAASAGATPFAAPHLSKICIFFMFLLSALESSKRAGCN